MSEYFDAKLWGKSKSALALERFLTDMDLSTPKMDDDYELRLSELRALFNRRIRVGFKRLSESASIPTKAHPTDSGFDLYALEDTIIEPGETKIIPTGIAVELPAGYEATVRPRSGIMAKTKLRVQLGTIDQSYRGELGVIVDNIDNTVDGIDLREGRTFPATCSQAKTIDGGDYVPLPGEDYFAFPYLIRKGDRIAQLVIQPLPAVEAYEIEGDIEETERGAGGFGSTGV